MSLSVVRTPDANADLRDIWSYIAADNRDAADALVRRITDMIVRLAENPDLGIGQDHIRQGLRCKPVKRRYLIFYETNQTELRILRVLHSARRYEALF